jgi:RNA polymerase sigma-70 factor (ECF subfamily)
MLFSLATNLLRLSPLSWPLWRREAQATPQTAVPPLPATLTEGELVQACLREEPAAMRELVERFQGDVFGLCYRLLGDRHEAEDVAQEVFLRVFRSLHRWDAARALKPWIVGITINRCRTFLAKRSRRPIPSASLHEHADQHFGADDSQELLGEIHLALTGLRPEFRDVFILFHEQGLPYEEIAQAMERPVGTIKTWLHRARLQVLQHLQVRGFVDEVAADELSVV